MSGARPGALAVLAALALLTAGCGGSDDGPRGVTGSTVTTVPTAPACAERYPIEGTVVSVSAALVRVEIDDAGGSGEGRIATVAPVRLSRALRRAARPRAGRRIHALVRDCGSVLVAERILR